MSPGPYVNPGRSKEQLVKIPYNDLRMNISFMNISFMNISFMRTNRTVNADKRGLDICYDAF